MITHAFRETLDLGLEKQEQVVVSAQRVERSSADGVVAC